MLGLASAQKLPVMLFAEGGGGRGGLATPTCFASYADIFVEDEAAAVTVARSRARISERAS